MQPTTQRKSFLDRNPGPAALSNEPMTEEELADHHAMIEAQLHRQTDALKPLGRWLARALKLKPTADASV